MCNLSLTGPHLGIGCLRFCLPNVLDESGGLKVDSSARIGPAATGKKMFLNRQHRAFGFQRELAVGSAQRVSDVGKILLQIMDRSAGHGFLDRSPIALVSIVVAAPKRSIGDDLKKTAIDVRSG